LEPEGSPEEETRIRSCSTIFFFGGGDDFRRSSSAASPTFFSCESAVYSRAESWGRNWNRSRSPKLAEVSSVEDLKYATQSKRDKVIQERKSKAKSYDVSRPKLGRALFPARGGGRTSRGLAGIIAPSSLPDKGERASRSSESSTRSTFACLVKARDVVGAADPDSSRTSTKSRPGYSPSSGWGG
jgi:hypothetical protein